MMTRIILLLLCIIVSTDPVVAQQENAQKKYWDYVKDRQLSEQCDYKDVFDAILGFSQYFAYDQQREVWKECENEIVEYIVFVHLSPDYKVDSVTLEVIGPRTDVVLGAFDAVKSVLSKKLLEWPACDIPVQLPNESWTVVLPFSFYSMCPPKHLQLPRTATQDLKNAISHYAKNNLVVVYPIGISGWMALHMD